MRGIKKTVTLPYAEPAAKPAREAVALVCAKFASDRARSDKHKHVSLPMPGSPECDATFLAAWAAHRHVTAELGRRRMVELGISVRKSDPLTAFVHGREAFPAHVRWAEAEAMIRAGEEWPR